MKIAVHSNAGRKFLDDIINHWEAKGHEVRFTPGADPELATWADLVYIDFLDSNFYCLFNGPGGDNNAPDWKSYPKNKVIVRAVDIDIWMGRHRDPRIWDYLDGMIVINNFFEKKIIDESGNIPLAQEKVHRVYCGINLDKFPIHKQRRPNLKIAMVADTMWYAKAPFEAVRIFAALRDKTKLDYTLHIRGQWDPPEWHNVAWDHLLKSLGIEDKVTLYTQVPDMSEWYEDKDYILCTSYKEAFSYAAAEGMAKGLKPVISNFFCAEELWPKEYIYRNWDDAIEMFDPFSLNPEEYRRCVSVRFPLQVQMEEYDRICGT